MNGVIPLLKPPGMSSQQAVARVRALAGERRAGHAGTLDPEAAGVLPVMLGRATKLSDYLMHSPKEYIAELCVGVETDTLDSEGSITACSPVRFQPSALERILPRYTGTVEQEVPCYAAVKVHGRRLYSLVRSGQTATPPRRSVQIDALQLLSSGQDRFLLRIVCRRGTYVRSLLRDLARELGTVGYTSYLLRSRAGYFDLMQSCTLEELENGGVEAFVVRPEQAVHLETICLPPFVYPILDSGTAIDLERLGGVHAEPDRQYAVYCRDTFFGIGMLTDRGLVLKSRLKS